MRSVQPKSRSGSVPKPHFYARARQDQQSQYTQNGAHREENAFNTGHDKAKRIVHSPGEKASREYDRDCIDPSNADRKNRYGYKHVTHEDWGRVIGISAHESGRCNHGNTHY